MKRLLFIVMIVAAAACAALLLVWQSHRSGGTAALALVPGDAIAAAVVPDVRRARSQWHGADIFKLWREPTVQDFLQKPLASAPISTGILQAMSTLDALGATDLFGAVTAIEGERRAVIGGFRFKRTQVEVETFVRNLLMHDGTSATPRETSEHRGHRIVTEGDAARHVWTAFTSGWFVWATDLAELKRMLDRIDGERTEPGSVLVADETFASARQHIPQRYAALFYARPDRLAPSLNVSRGSLSGAVSALRESRSLAIAIDFDEGRMRETTFAAMPKSIDAELARAALSIGTKETWLYVSGIVNSSAITNVDTVSPFAPWSGAVAATGVSADEWRQAFADEVAVLADWPADSRWPVIVATLPVKNSERAKNIAERLSSGAAGAPGWRMREKNSVRYFSVRAPGQMFAIEPTVALSDRMLIAGFGPESVAAAMDRMVASTAGLGASANFKSAESSLGPAKQGSAFIDTALFYTRLDAAMRPMLLMGAAFVPGIRNIVDLSKLPPAETMTRHLGPIGVSIRYDRDGYVAESSGPISFTPLIVAVSGAGTAGAAFYQQANGWLLGNVIPLSPTAAPLQTLPPLPTATATPPF